RSARADQKPAGRHHQHARARRGLSGRQKIRIGVFCMRPVFAAAAVLVVAAVMPSTLHAQSAPRLVVDPAWPKDRPKGWMTGQLSGVCVDGGENAYSINRRNVTDDEKHTSVSSPSITNLHVTGDVAAASRDETTLAGSIPGCVVLRARYLYV